jgi:oligopeptide transport system ATP-binding protein
MELASAQTELGTMVDVRDLRMSFRANRSLSDIVRRAPAARVTALDGVSVSVAKGKTLGIVGESGSGKSTLAKAMVRLIRPESGVVRVDGRDVLTADHEELRKLRRRMQLVYQDPSSSLNPRLKVGDAILEPARVHGLVAKGAEQARLNELLDQVGLPRTVVERRPRALSGGQRQRVAIARAFATEPEVLVADEITSALDVSIQAQIINLLAEMQREFKLTIVFISHDLPLVGHIADNVAVMYLGRIVEEGPAEAVFRQPAHPYTSALLSVQPSRERRNRSHAALSGEIPSPLDIPKGCRFRTRCPLAQSICAEVDPPRIEVSSGHGSWCHVVPPRMLAEK